VIRYIKTYKGAFFFGWLLGVFSIFFGYIWLTYTINKFGGEALPEIASYPVFLLYCIVFCMKFPITFLLLKLADKNLEKVPIFITFPIILTAVEFIIPELFPFFFGNMMHKNLLAMQIIDITGMPGMTFLVGLSNAFIFTLLEFFFPKETNSKRIKRFPYIITAITLIILIGVHLYGYYRIEYIKDYEKNVEDLKIGFIQPNTPMKRDDFKDKEQYSDWIEGESIRKYSERISLDLTRKMLKENENLDLIVWPESGVPFYYTINSSFTKEIKKIVDEYDIHMFINDYGEAENGYYNNNDLIGPPNGRIIDSYQKIVLLAFGEYNPFKKTFIEEWFPEIIRIMDASAMGHGIPGEEIKVLSFNLNGREITFVPQVCYEIIIPSLTREFTKLGGDFIINLTNDRWFGKTKATIQHYILGSARSIENRMYLLRSTVSGISTVNNAWGEHIPFKNMKGENKQFTNIFEKDYAVTTIKPLNISSFYKRYGNVFAWIITPLALAIFILSIIKIIERRFSISILGSD
jgi:apolipoprotein N-acyltransferase